MFLKNNLFICLLIIVSSLNGQVKSGRPEFVFHAVEKKETVFSIAKDHGVSPEEIYSYNPKSKEKIKPGDVLQIPKKLVSKEKVRTHKVKKGESLYFIAKKYQCSQEDILKLNPGISSSIQKGMVLIIPSGNLTEQNRGEKPSDKFTEYKIITGDTYFNLKKRFGADKEELENLNPSLKNGLKTGLVIKIPQKANLSIAGNNDKTIPLTKDHSDSQITSVKSSEGILNVALYLPFCGELNDSASIAAKTANYLEFYEGAMIAAENLTAEGLKIKMFVYDTHQDPKVVEQLVKKPEFLSLDLIIGPVYPQCQKVMAELSAKNRIPMVSPLSSDNTYVYSDPYFFQINPDKNMRLSGTADYLIKQHSQENMIVLTSGNGGPNPLINKLKQKGKSLKLHLYDIWSDSRSGIENQLNPETDNVIVLTDEDEARVSVAITRLNTVAKKFRITLVGIQDYTRFQSINTEYLHNLKFQYLTPYFIDYSNIQVIKFINQFRLTYNAEPSQYAFQGYDVMTSFVYNLSKEGKKFSTPKSLPDGKLLQANYNFQRVSNFGGFVNNTLFIIEYTDSWDIVSPGKIVATF